MASGKTEHVQLNQWSLDDPVQVEDFNQDNRTVDEALHQLMSSRLRLAMGTYTGTGEYGAEHPNTLTFDFTPKVLMIMCEGAGKNFILTWQATTTTHMTPYSGTVDTTRITFVWTDNGISWYSAESAGAQRNGEGDKFHYLVLGD